MLCKSLFWKVQVLTFSKCRRSGKVFANFSKRKVHISFFCKTNTSSKNDPKEVAVLGSFEGVENKNKSTYLDMIRIFVNRDNVHRRGHVEFIYAALKNMESFGVHKDLEVYKSLIDVLPKGKFIPTNLIQAEFMHYPKQQQCIVDLLEQMEDNGVMPDYEMEDILLNIFGRRAHPLKKFWRMMYWMPKFKNLSPWPVPDPVPNDVLELAKHAIERISSVDVQSKLSIYETSTVEDSIEDTWVVSAQSPKQKQLLEEHNTKQPIYVEGAFRVWIKDKPVNYFMLKGNPKLNIELKYEDPDDVASIQAPLYNSTPPVKEIVTYPSVHEQDDGVIFALCATGTSSKDSLLSWIRLLEKDGNPILATVPVVFSIRSGEKEINVVHNQDIKGIEER